MKQSVSFFAIAVLAAAADAQALATFTIVIIITTYFINTEKKAVSAVTQAGPIVTVASPSSPQGDGWGEHRVTVHSRHGQGPALDGTDGRIQGQFDNFSTFAVSWESY